MFCWEGGQAVAHFAMILVILPPPLLPGAALLQTSSLLGLGREWVLPVTWMKLLCLRSWDALGQREKPFQGMAMV